MTCKACDKHMTDQELQIDLELCKKCLQSAKETFNELVNKDNDNEKI